MSEGAPFEHVSQAVGGSLMGWDASSFRKTFKLETYPEKRLLEDVARLRKDDEWLTGQSDAVAKVYALAVKHAELRGEPHHEPVYEDPNWILDAEGEIIARKERGFRYTFEGFEERCQHPRMLKLASWLKDIVRGSRQRGIFMWGEPGTYKTWLQMATMGLAYEKGVSCVVWPIKDLVEDVQSTYSMIPGGKDQIFGSILKNRVICLDDLGREKGTPDSAQIVSDLIDRIYRNQQNHTLVVATNLTRKAIPESYDPALLSRLRGMCDGFEVPIEDTRGSAGVLSLVQEKEEESE